MKVIFQSFCIFLQQIARDGVLVMVLLAPVLAGLFFRFGIPAAEDWLTDYFKMEAVIHPYYNIIDLLLATMTNYMFCFVAAMTMLDEYDSHLISYLTVTPLRKKGYLFSRLYLPTGIGFFASLIMVNLFALTSWALGSLLIICLLTSMMAMSVALIIFSFSKNKVEGMAIAKISSLYMVGLVIPALVENRFQYLFVLLPSYWTARLMMEPGILWAIMALVLSLAWLVLLQRRFNQKLSH